MKYSIVEDRGRVFKFAVRTCSQEECERWMEANTKPHPLNDEIRVSINPKDVNDNGEPFTYTMIPIKETDLM